MTKLLTSEQMREADRQTIEALGLPGVVLMENAGAGVVELLRTRLPDLPQRRVLVLAGRGNNGGDGFVIARRLKMSGVSAQVILFGRGEQLQGDARINWQVFQNLRGRVIEIAGEEVPEFFNGILAHSGVVVDAVFGTGLKKPVAGVIGEIFQRVNRSGKPVIAVDIPSGVSADSGQVLGEALQADWTVTFAAEKIGHRTYPGAELSGEVMTVPIGIPDKFIDIPAHRVARNLPDDLVIPQRPEAGHKGSFGHLLVVAGGEGKAGAAVLTASGALRTGPGLVTVASPRSVQDQVATQLTEAMTLPLPEDGKTGGLGAGAVDKIRHCNLEPDALALGPGLGINHAIHGIVLEIIERWDVPTVVDADALNVFSGAADEIAALAGSRSAPLVLTPHPGELGRILGCSVVEIQGDRLGVACQHAARWGVWLVLKGAGTVIAAPTGEAWINDSGNSGLAAGGSGDLLTGIIGGLLTQGWPVESAVRAGVWLHGAAADAAVVESGPAGLMARDLLPHLRLLVNDLLF
ncbi:MAG: NAD(P)H-hydrate dehydratase [Magnetococcales bacterium]|nr:NAD(P)H-hydrate dehydratase [Magnetococcales bacterium]